MGWVVGLGRKVAVTFDEIYNIGELMMALPTLLLLWDIISREPC